MFNFYSLGIFEKKQKYESVFVSNTNIGKEIVLRNSEDGKVSFYLICKPNDAWNFCSIKTRNMYKFMAMNTKHQYKHYY